jgi:prevent-host-death family protein
MEVTIREAKSQLAKLIKVAEDGEPVTIVRQGVAVAKLTGMRERADRRLGWDSGSDVLRPMSDEEADRFLRGR